MSKLTDVQIRNWIKAGERFEQRGDGDGLYLSYPREFLGPALGVAIRRRSSRHLTWTSRRIRRHSSLGRQVMTGSIKRPTTAESSALSSASKALTRRANRCSTCGQSTRRGWLSTRSSGSASNESSSSGVPL